VAIAAVAGVFGSAASIAQAAGAVDVYVGYADNLRATPANFPTPWSGSPGIVFKGCTSSCSWDSSAVRIVNNTSIDQTIDSVAVKFGASCTIDLWPGTTTLHPGQQLIVAQTTSNPVGGCNPASGSIDGSDIGTTCSGNNGIIPEVDVSIDGTASSFEDTGQVLNTQGNDSGGCTGQNESIQWSAIGKLCSGAVLTLTPPAQTLRIGEPADLTATLVNGCGDPLQGAQVTFDDTSGPDTGKTLTAATDATGAAQVSYTSLFAGTDDWVASVQNPAGTVFSNVASVQWLPLVTYTGRAYALSLTLGKAKPITIADTGDISTPLVSDKTAALLNLAKPPLTARLLSSEVTTGHGTSRAESTIASVGVSLSGIPLIAVKGVDTTSTTTCSGSSGTSTLAGLAIAGHTVNVSNLAPNTTLNLGVGTLVLNEQTPVAGGLQVDAVHLIVPNVANLVVGAARSDIHNC
jgi:hypothetical protein